MYSINKKGRDFGVSFIVVNSHRSRTELNGLFFEKKVTMYLPINLIQCSLFKEVYFEAFFF